MKIYTYKDHEVSQFPPFKERPWMPEGDNVISTDDPNKADFIICPVALHRIQSKDQSRRIDRSFKVPVETLPHWGKHESKHVFFDCSDFEISFNGTSALLIRCNLRPWMLNDKNSIPWFWPVDDLAECTELPESGFKYDAGFHGWLSTNWRENSVNSCKRVMGDRFDHRTFKDFFGLMSDQDEQTRRRQTFLQSLRETRIQLCPQSIPGVFPYRFYEAISAQRIPALFCTDYILPFQDEIDWDKCTLRFPAEQASNAGQLIDEFLKKTTDEQRAEMAKYGREMWLKWLNRDRQPQLIAYALEKRGKELGILK